MIRKLKSGGYRLYPRKVDLKTGKRRNLGTFPTREKAEKHERAVQYFKRRRWSLYRCEAPFELVYGPMLLRYNPS